MPEPTQPAKKSQVLTKPSKPFFSFLFAFLSQFSPICRDLYYVLTTLSMFHAAHVCVGQYSCHRFEMVDGRSVNVRAQEPTQVNADTERIAIKLKRDAPAKVKLKVQITNRFVINTSVEAVVADKVRSAR